MHDVGSNFDVHVVVFSLSAAPSIIVVWRVSLPFHFLLAPARFFFFVNKIFEQVRERRVQGTIMSRRVLCCVLV